MAKNRNIPKLAVFCSGEGTNLQAILHATRSGRLWARVAVVISDRADAQALLRARKAGVEALFLDPQRFPTKAAYERAIIHRLRAHKVQFICLAGFMRILSPVLVHRYRGRILNIHPALLPAFPGGHAVAEALEWGVKITGVTVHLVDEQVDHGPILRQEAVTIAPADTVHSLLAKLHRVEHRLYPQAIRDVLEGRVTVRGRKVKMKDSH